MENNNNKEWKVIVHEALYLGEGWYASNGFIVFGNEEGQLKVETYVDDEECLYDDAGRLNYNMGELAKWNDEDSQEFLNDIKQGEYIFNSPEELMKAIEQNDIPIETKSVRDIIRYETVCKLYKKTNYKHQIV